LKLARFLFLAVCIFVFSTRPVSAREPAAYCPPQNIVWQEQRTESFALIFPEASADSELVSYIAAIADSEIELLDQFFGGVEISKPINLRFYPSELQFTCLNTDAPELPEGYTHARIGGREIAFIEANINLDLKDWQAQIQNAVRFELTALVITEITDHKTPAGLLTGAAGYLQDPNISFDRATARMIDKQPVEISLRRLWESESAYGDPTLTLQATSSIAYLVDMYGWPAFLDFLHRLAYTDNYLEALIAVYANEPGALEEAWQQYYPYYLQGRWMAHALYSFDLTPFETLIERGAYLDATEELKSAIAFLETIDEPDKLEHAQSLLKRAQAGEEASALVRTSRQALLNKDYELAIQQGELASQMYAQLNDNRRIGEIEIYKDWSKEVLDLRAELAQLIAQANPALSYADVPRLRDLGERLGTLGDGQSVEEINLLLVGIEQSHQEEISQQILIAVGLSLLLLIYLLITLRRKVRPEVIL